LANFDDWAGKMRRYSAGTPRFGKGQKILMRRYSRRIQEWQKYMKQAADAVLALPS
jgi:hypothetical protein